MANSQADKDRGQKVLEQYADGLSRDQAIISEDNKESDTRLIWFVAISGFALLNLPTLADRIASKSLDSTEVIIISIPWAITAIFAVITHWLLGELVTRDHSYYCMKQHSIRSFIANIANKSSMKEVIDIINVDLTDKEVAKYKSLVDNFFPIVLWSERITFLLVIFSFLNSILYPALFVK
jgi:hypothetical protein